MFIEPVAKMPRTLAVSVVKDAIQDRPYSMKPLQGQDHPGNSQSVSSCLPKPSQVQHDMNSNVRGKYVCLKFHLLYFL